MTPPPDSLPKADAQLRVIIERRIGTPLAYIVNEPAQQYLSLLERIAALRAFVQIIDDDIHNEYLARDEFYRMARATLARDNQSAARWEK